MKQETVTITKEEYKRFKELEKVDWKLVGKIRKSLDNISKGKIKVWKKEDLR